MALADATVQGGSGGSGEGGKGVVTDVDDLEAIEAPESILLVRLAATKARIVRTRLWSLHG